MPKSTVPKLARGSIDPPDDGASAIHSADVSAADATVEDVLNDLPVVVSAMVVVKMPPEKATLAATVSPGLIGTVSISNRGLG